MRSAVAVLLNQAGDVIDTMPRVDDLGPVLWSSSLSGADAPYWPPGLYFHHPDGSNRHARRRARALRRNGRDGR